MHNSQFTIGSEILAPAGSSAQLEASCRAGADAVYLGTGLFNARRNARNFNLDDNSLDEAVRSCHRRGVKVYLAMNTLVFDREIRGAALNLVKKACDLAVDAIIVQDIGLCSLIHAAAPGMPIHASTQMNIQNPAALPLLKSMGVTRVILPRELSLEEIRQICEKASQIGMETEVFVHGALCMSVSGQCYFSAMLGGRSGNRGLCAQPCRLPFSDNGLSLKDMSYLPHLKTLAELGINSFKIEGRMKRPEYAACAVAACRQSLEGNLSPGLETQLRQVFSRNGFTDRYLTGSLNTNMFGKRTAEDTLNPNSPVYAAIHALYKNEYQRVPVYFSIDIGENSVSLTARDDSNNTVSKSIPIFDLDLPPLSPEAIMDKLKKCGGTPYLPQKIDISDQPIKLRISQINALRRDCLTELSHLRENPPPIPFDYDNINRKLPLSASPTSPSKRETNCPPLGGGCPQRGREEDTPSTREFRVVFASYLQIPDKIPDKISRIYIPLETPADVTQKLYDIYGTRLAAEAPRGIFGQEDKIEALLKTAREIGIDECIVHTLGLIPLIRQAGMSPYGGFGLNLANTVSLNAAGALGLSGSELSLELTERQVGALSGNLPRGVTIYGRTPVMLTRNCPVYTGYCVNTGNVCHIVDKLGLAFPVKCRFGCTEVFNSIATGIVDKLSQNPSFDHFFLRFSVENSVEIVETLENITSGSTNRNTAMTRGLWTRGVL